MLNILKEYSEANEDMELYFKEIYGGFKLKLKEDIKNRERNILEY